MLCVDRDNRDVKYIKSNGARQRKDATENRTATIVTQSQTSPPGLFLCINQMVLFDGDGFSLCATAEILI